MCLVYRPYLVLVLVCGNRIWLWGWELRICLIIMKPWWSFISWHQHYTWAIRDSCRRRLVNMSDSFLWRGDMVDSLVNLVLCTAFNSSDKCLFSVTSSFRSLQSVACSVWKHQCTRNKWQLLNPLHRWMNFSLATDWLFDVCECNCYMNACVCDTLHHGFTYHGFPHLRVVSTYMKEDHQEFKWLLQI